MWRVMLIIIIFTKLLEKNFSFYEPLVNSDDINHLSAWWWLFRLLVSHLTTTGMFILFLIFTLIPFVPHDISLCPVCTLQTFTYSAYPIVVIRAFSAAEGPLSLLRCHSLLRCIWESYSSSEFLLSPCMRVKVVEIKREVCIPLFISVFINRGYIPLSLNFW